MLVHRAFDYLSLFYFSGLFEPPPFYFLMRYLMLPSTWLGRTSNLLGYLPLFTLTSLMVTHKGSAASPHEGVTIAHMGAPG